MVPASPLKLALVEMLIEAPRTPATAPTTATSTRASAGTFLSFNLLMAIRMFLITIRCFLCDYFSTDIPHVTSVEGPR